MSVSAAIWHFRNLKQFTICRKEGSQGNPASLPYFSLKNMKQIKLYFFLFIILLFLLGAYVYTALDIKHMMAKMGIRTEAMTDSTQLMGSMDPEILAEQNKKESCPNLLIKKGQAILLYDTTKPDKEGENPISFYNLDEYTKYYESQKLKGVNCPVLYLEEEGGAQGNPQYRVKTVQDIVLPSGFRESTLLENNPKFAHQRDANTANAPYNQNMYHGYDATSQNVGRITEVDLIHASTANAPISDNAMDSNWGGVRHSQAVVLSGKYDDNLVSRISYPTPRNGLVYPMSNPNIPERLPSA